MNSETATVIEHRHAPLRVRDSNLQHFRESRTFGVGGMTAYSCRIIVTS